MATQYVFAVGKIIASQPAPTHISLPRGAEARGDTRLAELLDWRRETGQELPLPADLIVWLEDRGYVTDLLTGCTSRLEPLQNIIDEAADTDEYELWQLEDKLENPASYPDYPLDHNDVPWPLQANERTMLADAYALGQADNAAGRYCPPAGSAEHDAYIRGQNDAWAAKNSVSWWRR